jgi:hypothetical protein
MSGKNKMISPILIAVTEALSGIIMLPEIYLLTRR